MRSVVLPVLLLAVVVTAMAAAYAKHQSRKLFVELQNLQEQRDAMNVEWGQLQLEQSTYTTHGKIDGAARERLHMHLPATQQVTIIHP